MALTTYDGLVAAIAAGETIGYIKTSAISQTAGRYMSLFAVAGRPGAASTPSTGAGNTCSSATTGAIPWTNPAGGSSAYLSRFTVQSTLVAALILADRLVETSGLSGASGSAQTTGASGTVALPARATGATDVEVWLQAHADLGATPQTATVSYTNSSGTAGRTATVIGGVPATLRAGQMIPCSLQAGDTGVQSVQSVTLAASTGTAGDFGVVLLRRISSIPSQTNTDVERGWGDLALPPISNDACLSLIWLNSSTSTSVITGEINIAKG